MTELDTFECDRCKDTFTVPKGEKHTIITLQDPYENEKPTVEDLCEDCYNSYNQWRGHHYQEFDKLSDLVLNKGYDEENFNPINLPKTIQIKTHQETAE